MARSGAPAKPRIAQAKAVKPIRTLKKAKSHRVRNVICGFLAGILSIAALLGTVSHILPAEIQAWPYVPIIVSLVPWFAILAVIALVAVLSRNEQRRYCLRLQRSLCKYGGSIRFSTMRRSFRVPRSRRFRERPPIRRMITPV